MRSSVSNFVVLVAACVAGCGDDAKPSKLDAKPEAAPVARTKPQSAEVAPVAAPTAPRGRCRLAVTVTRDGKPAESRVVVSEKPDVHAGGTGHFWFADDLEAPPKRETIASSAGEPGRFTVDGLPAVDFVVESTAPDGASAHARVSLRADGESKTVELRLDAPSLRATLKGRVLGVDGAPFHGFVAAVARDESGYVSYDAAHWSETATDGSFTLTEIDERRVVVAARIPGRLQTVGPPVVVPTDVEYVLDLSKALAKTRVRVIDEVSGEPIAAADVAMRSGQFSTTSLDRTDPAGRCALFGAPGTRSLYVTAAGYPAVDDFELDAAENEVEIPLRAGTTLRVHVVRADDGRPIAGAPVYVRDYGADGVSGADPSTRSGADGVAVVRGLAPGQVFVFVMSKDWYSEGLELGRVVGDSSTAKKFRPSRPPDVLPATGTTDVEVRVLAATAVEGVVYAVDGRPVAGAVVEAWPSSMLSFVGATEADAISGFPRRRALTGADGRFRVEGLFLPARYGLSATAEGRPGTAVGEVEARSSDSATLRFAAPHLIDVSVVDASDGSPLGGVVVSAALHSERRWSTETASSATTSADGAARLGPLVAGAFDVAASLRGYIAAPAQTTTLVDGAPSTRLAFRLTKGERLRGRAVLPGGATPESGSAAIEANDERRGRRSRRDSEARVELSADGTFEIVGLESGTHDVHVQATSGDHHFDGRARLTTGGGDGEVALEPIVDPAKAQIPDAPTFVVRVLGPDGRAVGTASIYAAWTDPTGLTQGTSFNVVRGVGRIPLAARGTEVTVSGAASLNGIPLDAATLRQSIPADAVDGHELRLAPGAEIAGRVVDDGGRPVVGVLVHAREKKSAGDPFANMPGEVFASAVSESDGSFALCGLDRIPYEVVVEAPADFEPPEPLVATGGSRDATIALVRGTRPVVVVVDPDGQPVKDAYVAVRRLSFGFNDDIASAETGPDGRATLPALAHGKRVRLEVSKWGAALEHSDEEWTPEPEHTVRLRRLSKIAGRALLPDGSPARGVRVSARTGRYQSEWESVVADDQGGFVFEDLKVESIDLVAGDFAYRRVGNARWPSACEPADLASAAVAAKTGSTDVELRIPAARIIRARIVGARGPVGDGASIVLRPTDGSAAIEPTLSPDGTTALFSGVSPTRTYEVLARIPRQNLVGRAAGVRAGTEVTASLEPGADLAGRIVLPDGVKAQWMRVFIDCGGVALDQEPGPDGRFLFACLPRVEGEFRAEVYINGRDAYRGSTKATPGTPLEFHPPPTR